MRKLIKFLETARLYIFIAGMLGIAVVTPAGLMLNEINGLEPLGELVAKLGVGFFWCGVASLFIAPVVLAILETIADSINR